MAADVIQTVAGVRPSPAETLLLRACLLEGPEAREAWVRWRARLDDPTDTFRGERARLRGLGPLLDAAARREELDAGSREMATALRAAGAREELRAAALRQTLARQLERLDDPVVVKGAALAAAAYPDPALRHTHDLDLLVADEEAETSEVAPSGVAVNHHPHLFRAAYHRPAEPGMRARLVAARVAGVEVRALAPDDGLVHVCAHAFSLGGADVAHWVPDAWFLLRAEPGLDWDRLLETAEQGRLAVPLSCLLGYLAEALGAAVPPAVQETLERDARAAGSTERDVALAAAWLARRSDGARSSRDRRRALALARWAIAPTPGYLRATGRADGPTGLARAYAGRPWRALGRRTRWAVGAR